MVQQQYRNRLARRFARANRALVERKRMLDNVARAKRHFKSAARMQGHWRGFLVRRALMEATQEAKNLEQRKRTQQEIELQRHKAFHVSAAYMDVGCRMWDGRMWDGRM